MKVRTIKTLKNRIYTTEIYVDDFSQMETQRMTNYGEPEINIGGTIPGVPLDIVYPDDLKRLVTDSPFTRSVDGRDFTTDVEAETAADEWAAEMVIRIKAAVDWVRALSDTFTEESLETY